VVNQHKHFFKIFAAVDFPESFFCFCNTSVSAADNHIWIRSRLCSFTVAFEEELPIFNVYDELSVQLADPFQFDTEERGAIDRPG